MALKILLINCCLLFASASVAQELMRSTTGVSGGSRVIAEGERSYLVQQSVGQSSVIGTFRNEDITARQGFIQPPIKVQRVFEDESDLDATIFPNPFSSGIQIIFNERVEGLISIDVFDIQGRLVHHEKKQAAGQLSIELETLSSAQYVLLVSTQTKQFKANILKD